MTIRLSWHKKILGGRKRGARSAKPRLPKNSHPVKASNRQASSNHNATNATQQSRWYALRYITLLLILLSFLAGGLLWLLQPATLPVKQIVLLGQQNTTEQQIRQKLAPFLQQNILNLDLPAMRQALLQLPWVAKVQLKRDWQQRLLVNLIEYQAVALWREADNEQPQATVTQNGDLLTFIAQQANLPFFVGEQRQISYMQQQYQQIEPLFSVANLPLLELHCDPRRVCFVILANGIRVWLGRHTNNARLKRFLQIYPQIVTTQPTPISDIDLRYPNGIAVRSIAK